MRISLGGAALVVVLLAIVVAGGVAGAPHVLQGWWDTLARELRSA